MMSMKLQASCGEAMREQFRQSHMTEIEIFTKQAKSLWAQEQAVVGHLQKLQKLTSLTDFAVAYNVCFW
jgi:hypothetical protein